MLWQVIEKDDYGTDWHQARYNDRVIQRFATEQEAINAAKMYLTELNCDNPLTKEEKKAAAEAFMMIDGCVFLGILDDNDWYLTYPKDISRRISGEMRVVHQKGDIVKEANYYELEGKTQIAVRPVPGT